MHQNGENGEYVSFDEGRIRRVESLIRQHSRAARVARVIFFEEYPIQERYTKVWIVEDPRNPDPQSRRNRMNLFGFSSDALQGMLEEALAKLPEGNSFYVGSCVLEDGKRCDFCGIYNTPEDRRNGADECLMRLSNLDLEPPRGK